MSNANCCKYIYYKYGYTLLKSALFIYMYKHFQARKLPK